MADTRQVVSWSLERRCQLRRGENWQDPNITRRTLCELQACAVKLEEGDLVDGIWVTSTYWECDAEGRDVHIPSSGVRVADVVEPFGGWEIVRSTCRDCEANVAFEGRLPVGGCHGIVDVMYPCSDELDALLWEWIRLGGLEDDRQICFPSTKPLWFGFWIDSPLRRRQCEFLLDLLPRCLPRLWGRDENDLPVEPVFDPQQFVFPDFDPSKHYGGQFKAFFRALRASIDWELPLHVCMAPPGHVDIGFYTQFAHCPRCKAEARIGRWQEPANQDYRCAVCGHRFDPSTTFRSEPDVWDSEQDSLERRLGSAYDSFAIRYGEANGVTQQQMLEALDNHRDGPTRRKVAECRRRVESLEQKYAANLLTSDWDRLPASLILEIAPGVTLEMIRISAGKFVMGSPENDQEQPLHTVRFEKPFYIGKYPIVQNQWTAVMKRNPSNCKGGPMFPVEQVNWFAAQEFCAQLSDLVGRHIRLPSEAEWEYACRAGTTTAYCFGEEITPEHATFDATLRSLEDVLSSSRQEKSKPRTTPVDRFPANRWGVCDMHGNVEEWCQDSWHASYDGAPGDGSAWLEVDEPVEHVARGGAAYTIGTACRSAARRQQRANCGARESTEENEPMTRFFGLRDWVEFYGLRVACFPISVDVVDMTAPPDAGSPVKASLLPPAQVPRRGLEPPT